MEIENEWKIINKDLFSSHFILESHFSSFIFNNINECEQSISQSICHLNTVNVIHTLKYVERLVSTSE